MRKMSYAIQVILSLCLLAAPAAQADQQAGRRVAGLQAAAAPSTAPCLTSRTQRQASARRGYDSCVHGACDAAWRRTAKPGDAAVLIRANYVSNCAKGAAPAQTAGGISQLVELAYVAAPGAAASTAGATGASAAVGGGIGLTTVLVPVAVVGAVAAGVVAASAGHADQPASP